MVMHGLRRYGYKEAARELAYRTFRMALDENPVTREFYDSDTGKGNGMNPFFGWSTLAYVMPLEVETGYNPMDFESQIKPIFVENHRCPV
jgi:putative isomerase